MKEKNNAGVFVCFFFILTLKEKNQLVGFYTFLLLLISGGKDLNQPISWFGFLGFAAF